MGFSEAAADLIYVYTGATVSAGAVGAAAGAVGTSLVGAGVSAALTPGRRGLPPSPVMPQSQVDQGQQQAQEDALRRQSIAGGINSSVGTSGGQAGQMLNPTDMGQKTLLGQ